MPSVGQHQMVGVVQIGLGPIGQGIVRRLLQMPGVRLVGAVDPAPDKAGRDVGALVGGGPLGVRVSASFEPEKLAGASVALHSTGSRLVAVLDQLLALVESGLDVISTCEELAWPWFHHADQARILDRAARRAGTTVVGT
ncbi:MAG: dihydrodipicolinate reductase, partial [Bacillota bacterium]